MEKLGFTPKNEESNQTINETESAEKPKNVFLGNTKDGAEVFIEESSHFHPEGGLTHELLRETLATIDTEGKDFLKEEVDFDQPIGEKTCVEVGPEDEIVMIYRKGRRGRTPMVKNRKAGPCNTVTVILKREPSDQDKDNYRLITSYIGKGSVREPWDPGLSSQKDIEESKKFWNTHALIYDDSLIDWERTKDFEFMSESAKKAELTSQKVVFAGLFVDPEKLHDKAKPRLERVIKNPHVTTSFKPGARQLNLDELGTGARIIATGYGNDGKNEGLLVKIEADDPAIQEACDALKKPHITLSVSKDGSPVDTSRIKFVPLEKPFEITGTYGLFSQGKVIDDKNELEQCS